MLNYLFDSAHTATIAWRIAQHLGYSFLALSIALLIALPLGLIIGHTGKGSGIVLATSGALRALPTLGLITWLALALPSGITHPLIPATVVLVVLGIPPILGATQSGVASISRPIVESAHAMGYSHAQVIRRVELPLAAGPILGGIRSAMLQVIATATIAAYIGLGGLGRLLLDGLAVRDFPQMITGALLVAACALLLDAPLALVQKRL